ncbi:5-(carboxyamino)imidazole ribonucleotide synthase [Thermoplasma sp.]|uniref:5-(carboxyamino)imidazole ribonucleotide synthase n=1 Tax=Thermoplasma sp. TaxID=1973142 RepID=UPI0026145E68|nr:5-(carboxyamino)imidazole ribonucleotide synthase [Thermoplasma sp.]
MNIGIIGTGQLGFMMINEGRRLGNRYFTLDSNGVGPASLIADAHFSPDEYRKFVDESDVVTFEFEHVMEEALRYAQSQGKLFPSIEAVDLKKDRSREKDFLSDHGLRVAEYRVANSFEEALRYAKDFGKAVIKNAYGGYDGKGQVIYDGGLSETLKGDKFVVEEFIDFDYEASIIAIRDRDGNFTYFDPTYNYNREAIFIYNIAPTEDLSMPDMALKLMQALDYHGVMGIEFYVKNRQVIINEYAPRVHNSGHHTLLGSSISQFEEHVRAISGLPVPKPVLYRPSSSINILGQDLDHDKVVKILSLGESSVYWYGKQGIRRRRKVGHVNLTGYTRDKLEERIAKTMEVLYPDGVSNYI